MRKIVYVIGLLLFGFSGLNGQVYNNQNLSIGVHAGINRCRIVLNDQKYNPALTPLAGVTLFSHLNKTFSLSYGAQFSIKGSDDVDSLHNIRSNYIEAFTSFLFQPTKGLKIGAGIQPGIGVKTQSVYTSGDSSTGKRRSNIDLLTSPVWEYYAEVMLDLNKALYLSYTYYLPFSNSEFTRMEFRLIYLVLEGYSPRR